MAFVPRTEVLRPTGVGDPRNVAILQSIGDAIIEMQQAKLLTEAELSSFTPTQQLDAYLAGLVKTPGSDTAKAIAAMGG